MKMIKVINAKKYENENMTEKILHCKNLDELCNIIGKTSNDIKIITYRKFYDSLNSTIYFKDSKFVNKTHIHLLNNIIISRINKSIKINNEYELSLPKNQRNSTHIRFENNGIDIMSLSGYYHIYFDDSIKTREKINYFYSPEYED